MNYYDARKRQDNGRWDYTRMNDGHISPVGNCAERISCACVGALNAYRGEPDCDVCGGDGFVPNPDHCGGHDTPELARACFRRFLLSDVREESYSDWTGCAVCDAPTKAGLTPTHPLGSGFPLCDEHRTREQLEALTGDVGQIVASY